MCTIPRIKIGDLSSPDIKGMFTHIKKRQYTTLNRNIEIMIFSVVLGEWTTALTYWLNYTEDKLLTVDMHCAKG